MLSMLKSKFKKQNSFQGLVKVYRFALVTVTMLCDRLPYIVMLHVFQKAQFPICSLGEEL